MIFLEIGVLFFESDLKKKGWDMIALEQLSTRFLRPYRKFQPYHLEKRWMNNAASGDGFAPIGSCIGVFGMG